MFHRSTLRIAVLAAVAAGAVLVPSAAVFASDATPQPAPTPTPSTATPSESAPPTAVPSEAAEPPTMPRGGVAAGDKPSPAPTPATDAPSVAPRGGVAAGERPAGNGNDATTLYGSAIGTVLLAGAGTLVLRRRAAAHRAG